MIDNEIIDRFDTISLKEMVKVRLMNRIDTKFITDIPTVEKLLDLASSEYRVQEIGGMCQMPYYTCYYDTSEADMFYQHQRGKKTRQKIRVRLYEESDTPPFLEVKSKNNKGRTSKKRTPMEMPTALADYGQFIRQFSDYDARSLMPWIENHFRRITLVNLEMTERITIDTELRFHNMTSHRHLKLDNLGVIEWKRDALSADSGLQRHLRFLRIHPQGFSKYCIGMAATDPMLRQNRLKPKLRAINRISPFM